ncbi:ABC transporter substrate-binding protein [Leucobacter tenebrionis]|uniref:ABC transporter substrate-binding protein n=1 Tax=Leucobacter tenebrionis TaxID=2873270 RepID=UPI001CA61BD7|nr:ABC transporter substrate-binding protein [Leucobacter tenebrionis]QZY51071.1 ABC transporter substrate-binding protein [Leucobacter tenebrionis]
MLRSNHRQDRRQGSEHMLQGVIERTFAADTSTHLLPQQVPAELWGYAKAFPQIRRPAMRFVWRDGTQWLDVQLALTHSRGGDRAKSGRVFARIRPSEMPRGLTVRELDVLTLVALGFTNGRIAERLGTSARTVSTQLERLLEKLGQSSRGGLAAIAVDLGLLRLPLPGGLPETGGLGIAELELAYQRRLGREHQPIRDDVPTRVPIRLGIVTPGTSSSDGAQVLGGALLAVDELNQHGGVGGRGIEAVPVEVDLFDWDSVSSGLDTLFESGVDAIVTSYVSAEHPQAIDRVAEYGKPFLHTATFEADVQKAEREPWKYGTVFQTCASENHYAPGMLRFLEELSDAGSWTPANRDIMSLELPSASMYLATPAFRELAASRGWNVVDPIPTPPGETDWEAIVARISEARPAAILFASYLDQEFAAFQRAFLRNPAPSLVYGIYAPSNPAFITELGQAADGVLWSTVTGTYDDEFGTRFREQYRAKYSQDPGWSIGGALYDQVRMLAAAWSSNNPEDVAEVVAHLRRWPYRGVNGVYYFGATGQSPQLYPDTTNDAALSQAHQIYQIQRSEHVLLSPQPFGRVSDFELPAWLT